MKANDIQQELNDKPQHECGIFGVYNEDGGVAATSFFALMALQHRGQECAGIAVNDNLDISFIKGPGLVNDVFTNEKLAELEGKMAVAHVLYSSDHANSQENAQPLVLRYVKGNLAITLNGSLLNKNELKEEYEKTGAIYQTTSDAEIIAYTIARQRVNSHSIEEAVNRSMNILIGAYSLLVMSPRKMIAARDPNGFHPLCMGRKGNSVFFASESCALDAVDAVFERDIEPGEIVVVENGKISSIRDHVKADKKTSLCIFNHVYFARPDSKIDGQYVNEARRNAGIQLAIEHPVDADIVIGVPDSGLGAAQGYAEQSRIPLVEGFIKNRYIARTFISPGQSNRERLVKLKLNPIKNRVEGKRVVMIEDSIVRGTTCARIVNLLREAGAKEIHVRVASPTFLWPCYYGADIPDKELLVATNNSAEGIGRIFKADSIGFLSLEGLAKIAPESSCGFCDACFTGKYPVEKR